MNKHLENYLYLLAESFVGITATYLAEVNLAYSPLLIALLNVLGKEGVMFLKSKYGQNNDPKGGSNLGTASEQLG